MRSTVHTNVSEKDSAMSIIYRIAVFDGTEEFTKRMPAQFQRFEHKRDSRGAREVAVSAFRSLLSRVVPKDSERANAYLERFNTKYGTIEKLITARGEMIRGELNGHRPAHISKYVPVHGLWTLSTGEIVKA